ncbi:MAG: hypothetical protein OEY19_07840 [Gammaproteobacteria bacterium]|nr:hypothetical protein [Gammaproteobacteria bacterium]MDH5628612.1 hypothetical protein [Gammaproteobacteria bacterium]
MKYLVLFLSFFSFGAMASQTICTHGDQERKIEIVYPSGGNVPCEVHYTKAGSSQVLWEAKNTEGYCEEKAAEFVAKQENWGWSCSAVAEAPEAPEAPAEETPAAEPAAEETTDDSQQ